MIEEVYAGVDWLTLTMSREASGLSKWKRRGISAVEVIAKEGYQLISRRMNGYEGISAGNCFFGEREDGFMLQLTGSHANDHFDRVYSHECRVPRIDVQFTAKYDVMPANLAKKGYHDAKLSNDSLPSGRRRKINLFIGSDGGDTLYIGSPSSDQRGRMYNKEVQSEDPNYARTWRYEVMFRNELAHNCAQGLPKDPQSRAQYIELLVSSWYGVRGVDSGIHADEPAVALPLQRTLPTDVERKLKWLEEQVAPTVRYLCDLGFRDMLLARLFPNEPES